MAATFQFAQTYGAGAGTTTDIGDGSGGNYWNYKNVDDATPANYSSNPITANTNSYSVYVRGHFTGTFNAITNVLFWASDLVLTGYGTGALLSGSVQTEYVAPSTVDTTDSNIPTVVGSALDLSQAGAGTIAVGTAGYSKYARTQLETKADATPGDGGTSTLSARYDES